MVKVGVVLDAPRVRLRVGARRTHGDELFEHGVPHLPVSCVWCVMQDDATRATRSVDVVSRVHDVVGTPYRLRLRVAHPSASTGT